MPYRFGHQQKAEEDDKMTENRAKNKQKAAEIGQTCICFNLRKAMRLLTAHYDQIMKPTGLKITQFSLLMALLYQDAISVSQLANNLGMDRTTLSRNVRLLEQKDLIAVFTGADRREQCLVLTDKGKETIELAIPFWEQAQAEVITRFGEEWVQVFLSNLKQFNSLNM